MTQVQLAYRAGVTESTVRKVETGRTQNPYKLRDLFRVLGLEWTDDRSPELAGTTDEELIRELQRRHGRQTADALRGYLEERSNEDTEPDTSQSRNDAVGDNAAS